MLPAPSRRRPPKPTPTSAHPEELVKVAFQIKETEELSEPRGCVPRLGPRDWPLMLPKIFALLKWKGNSILPAGASGPWLPGGAGLLQTSSTRVIIITIQHNLCEPCRGRFLTKMQTSLLSRRRRHAGSHIRIICGRLAFLVLRS